MNRKFRYVVAAAAAACALGVSSVAWACTTQNGRTFITHPNGCELTAPFCSVMKGSNTYIAVHAEGMVPGTSSFGNLYTLYFSYEPWCHPHPDSVELHPPIELTSNVAGRLPTATQIDPTTATYYEQRDNPAVDASLADFFVGEVDVWANIPRDISLTGTHDVCFNNAGSASDPYGESSSSYPQSLTVT